MEASGRSGCGFWQGVKTDCGRQENGLKQAGEFWQRRGREERVMAVRRPIPGYLGQLCSTSHVSKTIEVCHGFYKIAAIFPLHPFI
jgi:hypothetical protein